MVSRPFVASRRINALPPPISSRRPWYNKFRAALSACEGVDDVEHLLSTKVTRWRGKASRENHEASNDLEYTMA